MYPRTISAKSARRASTTASSGEKPRAEKLLTELDFISRVLHFSMQDPEQSIVRNSAFCTQFSKTAIDQSFVRRPHCVAVLRVLPKCTRDPNGGIQFSRVDHTERAALELTNLGPKVMKQPIR